MLYFAHTLKACGPLAFALVLSACGEETNVAGAASAKDTEGSLSTLSEQGYERLSTDPSSRSQSTVNQQFSPPQSNSSEQSAGNEQTPGFLVTAPSNLNKTQLAAGNNLMDPETQNSRPDPTSPISERPKRQVGETLPVEPPEQRLPEAPIAGGDPLVSLVAKTDGSINGGATQLEWSTENVDACETSGAWKENIDLKGVKNLSHEASGEHTYMISCRGAQGTAMAMVTITVESTALAWQAPASNTDGSALTDLAGYNMYYGTESGRYTKVKAVPDATKTELDLPVEPGTYYLAVTAYDMTGNESALSNEIIRVVN